jgi:5,10-methenyltetrahydrofolate synthetase
MTKDEIRKSFLAKRTALSETEVANFSRAICDHFFSSIDLSFLKIAHIFLPIPQKKEPDTWLIIERIRREFSNIQLSLPKVVNDQLENYRFEGMHQLEQNKWGIWEPKQGVLTPTTKIDLVLVPLLAVDSTGHRVGYGKGFYDRFLKSCRPDCKKIGLSFFDPIDKIDDLDDHDIPLTAVIAPNGFKSFQQN